MNLEKLLKQDDFTRDDLIELLSLTKADELEALYAAAYETKKKFVGNVVYYRGLIEFSNRCIKNCKYCGIRRDNKNVHRFDTPREKILAQARWAWEQNYGSLVLQSGERQDESFINYVEGLLCDIKKFSRGELGVTLCVGEQTKETYARWFAAGAHRYLLRIESSNPKLYRTLHPQDGRHEWEVRRRCLDYLRECGYQVGTGVMIGLPGQTIEDLADDILFYKELDVDMIGMGPYVVHHDTPIGIEFAASGKDDEEGRKKRLQLGLKMIAVTRLFLKDVNIASTTALQALHPFGRELGLKAGANVIMPVATLPEYRPDYLLYDGKPCVGDDPEACRQCLEARIASVGDVVGYGAWGDSRHFAMRRRNK